MPAIIIPQLLLCGLLVPRDAMPPFLEAISDVLPLSYAVDAMQHLTTSTSTGQVWQDVAVVAAFAVGGLALGPRPCAVVPSDVTGPSNRTERDRGRSLRTMSLLRQPAPSRPQRAVQRWSAPCPCPPASSAATSPARPPRTPCARPPRWWTTASGDLDFLGEDTLDAEQADATVTAYLRSSGSSRRRA